MTERVAERLSVGGEELPSLGDDEAAARVVESETRVDVGVKNVGVVPHACADIVDRATATAVVDGVVASEGVTTPDGGACRVNHPTTRKCLSTIARDNQATVVLGDACAALLATVPGRGTGDGACCPGGQDAQGDGDCDRCRSR